LKEKLVLVRMGDLKENRKRNGAIERRKRKFEGRKISYKHVTCIEHFDLIFVDWIIF